MLAEFCARLGFLGSERVPAKNGPSELRPRDGAGRPNLRCLRRGCDYPHDRLFRYHGSGLAIKYERHASVAALVLNFLVAAGFLIGDGRRNEVGVTRNI